MGYYETFSQRRKKQETKDQPDVYQYDVLPYAFRNQVVHIVTSLVGEWVHRNHAPYSNNYWSNVHRTYGRAIGRLKLNNGSNPYEQCLTHISTQETEEILDLIEVAFRCLPDWHYDVSYNNTLETHAEEKARAVGIVDAIEELNFRFKQHCLGYEYVIDADAVGEIIRIDSEFVHAKVIKPTLSLLQDAAFTGASEEFLRAHESYRNREYHAAINEAAKAFESTMKTICDARSWDYDKDRATANTLIGILFDNELLPSEIRAQFTSLRALLESGAPTVRNRRGAHGQGAQPVELPGHLAAYALHLAAVNIVFLVEAHRAKT